MEVPRTTFGGPIFDQVERFFDKTVGLCSFELVNEHSDRRHWHSPSQWVLGRSLRLSFQRLSRASQLASHQRHRDDFAYQRRVAMLAEAQRSIISTRYNKAFSRALLSRARSANNDPSQVRFCSRRPGHVLARKQQAKKSVVNALVGPGIVIGHEGRANVWTSHRNAVVKTAGNHVRLAQVEERLPFKDSSERYALSLVVVVGGWVGG